jgi:hypothetical protein
MKFRNWLENEDDLHQSEIDFLGSKFRTGDNVKFNYLRNTEKAPNFGSLYQQDIEPHGRYVIQDYDPTRELLKNWERGEIEFNNPLVILFNPVFGDGLNERSWKARLSKKYGGKTGLELSKAIVKDGYDGIVTLDVGPDGKPYDTREIVDLRWLLQNK